MPSQCYSGKFLFAVTIGESEDSLLFRVSRIDDSWVLSPKQDIKFFPYSMEHLGRETRRDVKLMKEDKRYVKSYVYGSVFTIMSSQ